jgi:hypothetical protein
VFDPVSKPFAQNELISTSELKEMNNRHLFDDLLNTCKKLGLVHDNQLRAVILDIKTYEQLMHRLEELEEILEDMKWNEMLQERIRLPETKWLEKPEQMSRLAFFEQTIDKGSSSS